MSQKIKQNKSHFSLHAFAIFTLLLFAFYSRAQEYPPAEYSPAVPTLEQVVGHHHGEQISSPSQITDYFAALAETNSQRMQVHTYAQSWQGRDLQYAVISSEQNIRKLEDVKKKLSQLGDGASINPETLNDLPAVVWLSFGVHGDEVTPPDSALFLAYHLLAAKNNELVDKVLENVIVILDPSQNPDGRARFVHSFYSSLGMTALDDRHTAEHNQPWPRGRFNHYLFDLNRDWFAMTQPETQGKVAAVLEWHPVIYVDSHEMSGDSTYYFPPAARPYNPNITKSQRQTQAQLGKNMATWFDQFGVPYFTREVYDAFYPGYGDMWPTLNGAIAMTFEQASPRGLRYKRKDGTVLTFADGVRNNVLTTLATLETVSNNKNDFLNAYREYRASASKQYKKDKNRYFVFDLSKNTFEAESLARNLAAQGVEVQRIVGATKQCKTTLPNGAIIVDKAQAQGRLIDTLLSEKTELADEFITEQERRRDAGLRHQLYDVTAWSLPLMHGVSVKSCSRVDLDGARPIVASEAMDTPSFAKADFAYAVPWDDGGQVRLVIEALKSGLVGKTTDRAFTYKGKVFPMGSVIFSQADNDADLFDKLTRISKKFGAEVSAMSDSWVEDGPNFGSRSFVRLSMPKVAIGWGEGTAASSAGNTRFVLERQLGIPVAPIRLSNLNRADLSLYDVLILPDTYGNPISRMASKLNKFVAEGGVLIAIESSVANIASDAVGLLATKREYASNNKPTDSKSNDSSGKVEGQNIATVDEYEALTHNHKKSPEDVPGVLLKSITDNNHWLSSGYDAGSVSALLTGRDIYTPLNKADGVNVFYFAGPDQLLQSGYLWEENRQQLAYKPFVMASQLGSGMVIAFTQSPTTRAYLNGLNVLLANAVVIAPARN